VGFRIGGRYVGMNGRPFSATVNGDINGDEATSNDLAFVFDPANPSTPAAVAASMRKVLDNPANVARDYLHDNLGHIASRNGAFAPWTERIDIRFTTTIHTVRGQSPRSASMCSTLPICSTTTGARSINCRLGSRIRIRWCSEFPAQRRGIQPDHKAIHLLGQ
jgi:hypothetical protein